MNRIAKTIAMIAIGAGAMVSSWSMGSVADAATASRPPVIGTYPHCVYGVAHGSRGPQCSMPEPRQPVWDNAFCAYFPEFGSSLRHAEATRREWAPLVAHWWADRSLHADARSLLVFLRVHPRAASTGGRYVDVYLGCNPDA